jgi:hypothetical protein
MIVSASKIDKALGTSLQQIYRTHNTPSVERARSQDVVTISELSSLVERGRAMAMATPDVRKDVVSDAKVRIALGEIPGAADLASKMIKRAVEGTV